MKYRMLITLLIFVISQTSFSQSPKAGSDTLKFDFGPGKVEKGYQAVRINDIYTGDKGFGFRANVPLTGKQQKGGNSLINDLITCDEPFYFEVDLPEGNYRVSITFGDEEMQTSTTVKAESRRLMLEKVVTQAGEFVTKSFSVNVRTPRIGKTDSIRRKPREMTYLNWDHKLSLEFNGDRPVINALEIAKLKEPVVVFLAGNSTVTDQEKEPWAAWGQMIPAFFDEGVVVANYAESGESLRSFRGRNRLVKILSLLKEGDYLFIEFAHNDQKPGGSHVEPFTTYQDELKYFITEARKKGGKPVLVTSMHRRKFDENAKIVNTLEEYPEAMRQTAEEENVPLIDLNAMSKVFYESMGVEESKIAFVHYPANTYPGQNEPLEDNTHFNNYGAYQLAKCIVEGIKENVPGLAKHLKENIPSYDPAHPDNPETFDLPASPTISNVKPDGN